MSENIEVVKNKDKVGQDQIHGLLFGEKLGWQAIIYDLINSEQLDPWDIDISLLSNKYLGRIKDLEQHNFFVSSKVLLAAALLLRMKSEILLSSDLKSLDDILFGREEKKKYVQERIELDDDLPDLIPRTPLPRHRRVTLKELMTALGKAITTETRRIKRVVVERQHEREAAIAMPKNTINLRDQVRNIRGKLRGALSEDKERVPFSEFAGESKEEKINHFIPLLHLDYQKKVWLEQEGHLEEIWIWLHDLYMKKNAEKFKEVDESLSEEEKEAEEVRHSFDNIERF